MTTRSDASADSVREMPVTLNGKTEWWRVIVRHVREHDDADGDRRRGGRYHAGFLDGFRGVASAVEAVLTRITKEWESLIADRTRQVQAERAAVDDADAAIDRSSRRLDEAMAMNRPEVPAGALTSAVLMTVCVAVTVMIIAGEAVFFRMTVARVFRLASREAWIFSIALTALVLPLEFGLGKLLRHSFSSGSSRLARAGVLGAYSAMVVATLLTFYAAARLRQAYLAWEEATALVPPDVAVDPFLSTVPGLGETAMVLVTLSLALGGTWAFALCVHHMGAVGRWASARTARIGRAILCWRAARAADKSAQVLLDRRMRLIEAETRLGASSDEREAELAHAAAAYHAGYQAGARARGASSRLSDAEAVAHAAHAAFDAWIRPTSANGPDEAGRADSVSRQARSEILRLSA